MTTKRQQQLPLQDAERRARDLKLMATPLKWPLWPILPLKRGKQPEDPGFLYADGSATVRLVDIHAFAAMTPEQRKAVRKRVYLNFAALVADGWRIA